MDDLQKLEIEFWYDFDNYFMPTQATQAVLDAYAEIGGVDFFRRRRQFHRDNGTYPVGFQQEAIDRKNGLLILSEAQLAILDQHFGEQTALVQRAFEDFGQGILFDDRRRAGDKIHKMDIGGPDRPPIGYHRWHAIIRAAVLAGADANVWLQINRYVGLAWAIQSEVRPEEDNPNNPSLPVDRLATLRDKWLALSVEDLESQFDSFPYPLVDEPILSFELDIRPLFREFDRTSMQFIFDLWKYEDVKDNAADIFARLNEGSMPCDGEWPRQKIDLFRRWMIKMHA